MFWRQNSLILNPENKNSIDTFLNSSLRSVFQTVIGLIWLQKQTVGLIVLYLCVRYITGTKTIAVSKLTTPLAKEKKKESIPPYTNFSCSLFPFSFDLFPLDKYH